MGMPSNSTTSLNGKYTSIKDVDGNIKDGALRLINIVTLSRKQTLDYLRDLIGWLAVLDARTANASANGLLAYAQSQENNASLDLAAAFSAMRAQIVLTRDFISNNMPKDASGNFAVYAPDATGYVDVPLTTTERNALNTRLNALVATID